MDTVSHYIQKVPQIRAKNAWIIVGGNCLEYPRRILIDLLEGLKAGGQEAQHTPD